MDITTIAGLIGGFYLLIATIFHSGELIYFIDIPSFLMTVGGTFMALLVSTPSKKVTQLGRALWHTIYFPAKFLAVAQPQVSNKAHLSLPKPATHEELQALRMTLALGVNLLRRLRPYPIGWGVLGATIGLFNLLRNIDHSGDMGPGLAWLVILPPLYGIILTFLFILPLSQKLQSRLDSLQ